MTWADAAEEFLKSKEDPELLQNFVNSWLAECWEDTKLKTSEELVMERQTQVEEFVVPDWTRLITGGVDIQENCVYYTVRAWGEHITSQNITHGQVSSFSEIENIMNLEWRKQDGTRMVVNLTLIDSGYEPDATYDFCADNSDWAFPCKGASNEMDTYYRISKVNKTSSKAYGMQLIIVDGSKYKDMIAGRMRRVNGRGSWMVYQGCDGEYAKQVTSEHKINVKTGNGKLRQEWVVKTSHADNHYLDCEVYAMAAADILGVRTLHLQENSSMKTKEKEETPEEKWINVNEKWV